MRKIRTRSALILRLWIIPSICSIPIVASATTPITETCPCAMTVAAPGNHYYLRIEKDGQAAVYRHSEHESLFYTFRDVDHWVQAGAVLSEDGTKVAQRGPYGIRSTVPPEDAVGVAFYDRGKLIAKYSVSDLVEDPKCFLGQDFYLWGLGLKWLNGDESSSKVELDTLDNRAIVFDIRTGKLLERNRITAGCFTPKSRP